MRLLSDKVNIKRRYFRSINVERDLRNPDAISGFVVTNKSVECLDRFATAFAAQEGNRAWTLTGPYGSGKSSFSLYLLSLLGPKGTETRKMAEQILKSRCSRTIPSKVAKAQRESGYVRCIASCRVEPVAAAVLRAIKFGTEDFFAKTSRKLSYSSTLNRLLKESSEGHFPNDDQILDLLEKVGNEADAPIVIVLDELGKCLDYASRKRAGDLFLLQQLAELPTGPKRPKVFILGLLHQSFADYADLLSQSVRNEWHKVQGRFEDISFTESTQETLGLLSDAVTIQDPVVQQRATQFGRTWSTVFKELVPSTVLPDGIVQGIYPIHPLAACLLPQLCSKLGQNERSLFTLLTSDEPAGFASFLTTTELQNSYLPTYKLCDLYDYFAQCGIKSGGARSIAARWNEIEDKINCQSSLEQDQLNVLKTVGLFNLISTGGSIRATKKLIALSLSDDPLSEEVQRWESLLDDLAERKILGYRKHIDEYRIWEGTDFDIDLSLSHYHSLVSRNFANTLAKLQPLGPVIAQRNSYETGTLRLFDSVYCDDANVLPTLACRPGADGLIVYWLSVETPESVPAHDTTHKPLILLTSDDILSLQSTTIELLALQSMIEESPELQIDRVARKEVRHRLLHSQLIWHDTFHRCFGFVDTGTHCWSEGRIELVTSPRRFNALLSEILERTYSQTPVLWNELINRRELTSQGAKARRELIEAQLTKSDLPLLGLSGNGPEVSMYKSVLEATGIHRQLKDKWSFDGPSDKSFIPVWKAIERHTRSGSTVSIADLYTLLEKAPFGLKSGVVPVLLAAYFVHKQEELSLYKEGTFVGAIGPEHFELLVKAPEKFAVKSLVPLSSFSKVFAVYQEVASRNPITNERPTKTGILSVVRPLVNFVKRLPPYSQQCQKMLPVETVRLRQAILQAVEPDQLLFNDIPQALGFTNIDDSVNGRDLRKFAEKLTSALKDLNGAYTMLLQYCANIICAEYGISLNQMSHVIDRLGRLERLENSEFAPLVFQVARDNELDPTEASRRFAMVIADKPPDSWTDTDLDLFPGKARMYIAKLRNYEALHAEMSEAAEYRATRLSILSSDGAELSRIVHIDKSVEKEAAALAQEILAGKLFERPELREAVIAKLAEQLFHNSATTELSKSSKGRK